MKNKIMLLKTNYRMKNGVTLYSGLTHRH